MYYINITYCIFQRRYFVDFLAWLLRMALAANAIDLCKYPALPGLFANA